MSKWFTGAFPFGRTENNISGYMQLQILPRFSLKQIVNMIKIFKVEILHMIARTLLASEALPLSLVS